MKRIAALLLVLTLLLAGLVPAQAETLCLQEPSAYSNWNAVQQYHYDLGAFQQNMYTVSASNQEKVITAYRDLLMGDVTLVYLGQYTRSSVRYVCFAPAYGYQYDTFKIYTSGAEIQPLCCVAIQYTPNSGGFSLLMGNNIQLLDYGKRMSGLNAPTAVPTVVPTAIPTVVPTKYPTAVPTAVPTPKPTAVPTAVPTPKPTATPKPLAGFKKLQDLASFSNGIAKKLYDYDKESHQMCQYELNEGWRDTVISAYVAMLNCEVSLEYLGAFYHGDYCYECFGPAEGYAYNTFKVSSYGEALTPKCCIALQYETNGEKVYLRYANGMTIADNNYRMP